MEIHENIGDDSSSGICDFNTRNRVINKHLITKGNRLYIYAFRSSCLDVYCMKCLRHVFRVVFHDDLVYKLKSQENFNLKIIKCIRCPRDYQEVLCLTLLQPCTYTLFLKRCTLTNNTGELYSGPCPSLLIADWLLSSSRLLVSRDYFSPLIRAR